MFAGPNGSGKSTITRIVSQYEGFPKNYINADDIKANSKDDISAYEAAAIAEAERVKSLEARESFAFETVMSHESKVQFMKEAKDKGFHINLFYVATQDEDINLKRVQKRVRSGGHDVPTDKIVNRYKRSMAFLKEAFALADEAFVYNNSFKEPVKIARKYIDGNIKLFARNIENHRSKWSKLELEKLLGLKNAADIVQMLQSNHKNNNDEYKNMNDRFSQRKSKFRTGRVKDKLNGINEENNPDNTPNIEKHKQQKPPQHPTNENDGR